MPYVADQKIDYRSGALKALRNFSILAGVILGFSLLIIWRAGYLGPLFLVPVSEADARTRCEQAVAGRLRDARSVEIVDLNLRQHRDFWSGNGVVVTEGERGGFWQQNFTCRIEANEDMFGQTVSFHNVAQRIPDPVD